MDNSFGLDFEREQKSLGGFEAHFEQEMVQFFGIKNYQTSQKFVETLD